MIRDGYKIIIGASIFIFIATVVILINPFDLLDIEAIKDRATLSSDISTSIAIILGIIAIYVTATVESARFHVKRDLKKNIMMLKAVLPQSLKMADGFIKHAVITNNDDYTPFFAHDASTIRSILYSPTGDALRAWDIEFYQKLVGILHVMVGLHKFEENNNRLCVMGLVELLLDLIKRIESITQKDIDAIVDVFDEFDKDSEAFFKAYEATNAKDPTILKLRKAVENGWGMEGTPSEV